MAETKKRKYTKQETKNAMPGIRDFNKIAGMFLNLLTTQIKAKEDRIRTISVFVDDFRPRPKWHNTINIETIDMKSTTIRRHADGSFNNPIRWEDDFRSKRKGVIL